MASCRRTKGQSLEKGGRERKKWGGRGEARREGRRREGGERKGKPGRNESTKRLTSAPATITGFPLLDVVLSAGALVPSESSHPTSRSVDKWRKRLEEGKSREGRGGKGKRAGTEGGTGEQGVSSALNVRKGEDRKGKAHLFSLTVHLFFNSNSRSRSLSFFTVLHAS